MEPTAAQRQLTVHCPPRLGTTATAGGLCVGMGAVWPGLASVCAWRPHMHTRLDGGPTDTGEDSIRMEGDRRRRADGELTR